MTSAIVASTLMFPDLTKHNSRILRDIIFYSLHELTFGTHLNLPFCNFSDENLKCLINVAGLSFTFSLQFLAIKKRRERLRPLTLPYSSLFSPPEGALIAVSQCVAKLQQMSPTGNNTFYTPILKKD